MFCASRQRLWIDIWSDSERIGSFIVLDGELIGCATMGYGGDEALLTLAAIRKGKFRVYPAHREDASALPATVRSWQELVLEAARLQDESERRSNEEQYLYEQEIQRTQAKLSSWHPPQSEIIPVASPYPSPPPNPQSSIPAAPPTPRSPRDTAPTLPEGVAPPQGSLVDQLQQQATDAYLRRDFSEALRLFTECLALRPGDRHILHNIERLKKRGTK